MLYSISSVCAADEGIEPATTGQGDEGIGTVRGGCGVEDAGDVENQLADIQHRFSLELFQLNPAVRRYSISTQYARRPVLLQRQSAAVQFLRTGYLP